MRLFHFNSETPDRLCPIVHLIGFLYSRTIGWGTQFNF
jgi:hypothetical protein